MMRSVVNRVRLQHVYRSHQRVVSTISSTKQPMSPTSSTMFRNPVNETIYRQPRERSINPSTTQTNQPMDRTTFIPSDLKQVNPHITSVDPQSFRNAFRQAASSVWVVTSSYQNLPIGFTAISVVSASAEPAMLSFNLNKTSSSLPTILQSMKFAVHLLQSDEAAVNLAKKFASKPSESRFDDQSIYSIDKNGLPNINGSLQRLSGRIVSLTDAGDSYVALGVVEEIESNTGAPLVHHSGKFHLNATSEPVASQTSSSTSSKPTSQSTRNMSTTSSKPKKQIGMNAFSMCCVGHQSPGLWAYPQDQSHRYKELSYWTDLAKLLDRGGFDCLFLADVVGTYDVYQGSRDAAVRQAAQVPVLDPTVLVPAMAAVTTRMGFAVTVSLTYEKPYAFARRLSSLDHWCDGRVGWNIVTSYLKSAAINLGLDDQIPHDERYDLADEFLDVTYKLLEGSWEEDAVVMDREKRVFTIPSKVHDISHVGKYFKVPGAHLCEPSRQRTPVLFQAGTSTKGKQFGAKHAEAMFVNSVKPEPLRKTVDDLRAQVKAAGRDPQKLKIYSLATVIVDETEEKAQAKLAEYKSYASVEGALALFGGWSGTDLGSVDPDAPLKYVENDAIRSVAAVMSKGDSNKQWTARDVADFIGVGGFGPTFVGSPEQIVDEMERWMEVSDIDGFNFAYVHSPGSFEDIVKFVVPELRRRGLLPELAEVPEHQTLREKLFGEGPRLPSTHTAAQYRR